MNRRTRKMLGGVFFILGIFLMSSCSLTPSEKKVTFREELPQKYNDDSNQKDKKTPYKEKWWQIFQDKQLNALIEDVIKHNLDLKLALGNINVLRTQYQLSKVNTLPVVTASAGANVARSPRTGMTLDKTTGAMVQTTSAEVNDSYSLQLNAMFEVDFFDKYGAFSRSALHQLKASEADYHKAYFMIISQTIVAYFDLKMLQTTIELYEEMIKTYEEELNIQKKKYETGLGMRFNINALEQTIASTKSTIESLKKDLRLRKYSVKLLRGKYPKEDEFKASTYDGELKKLEEFSKGVPSDLLKNRYDILASKQRLDAAREMIGYRKADRFPSVSLSAAFGFMNVFDLDQFFDSDFITMSGGVNVTQTLFSYGSKKANYEQAVEQHNLALLNYKKVILNAFHEVEGHLVSIDQMKKQEKHLKNALSHADASLEEAKRRFIGGIGEYQTILDLTKSRYNLEVNRLNIKRAMVIAYINLYQSLGKR